MSHCLTQPEEIDQILKTHESCEDSSECSEPKLIQENVTVEMPLIQRSPALSPGVCGIAQDHPFLSSRRKSHGNRYRQMV